MMNIKFNQDHIKIILQKIGGIILMSASIVTLIRFIFGVPNLSIIFTSEDVSNLEKTGGGEFANLTVLVREAFPVYGYIFLRTKPIEVSVFLDNVEVGLSPLNDYQITNGIHVIRISKEGYIPEISTVNTSELAHYVMRSIIFKDTPADAEFREAFIRKENIKKKVASMHILLLIVVTSFYIYLIFDKILRKGENHNLSPLIKVGGFTILIFIFVFRIISSFFWYNFGFLGFIFVVLFLFFTPIIVYHLISSDSNRTSISGQH